MSTKESPLVATLRLEIERKYREALQALDTLSGYLDAPSAPVRSAEQASAPELDGGSKTTRVDVVLGAMSVGGEYMSVEQLQSETGLSEEAVRAVLYSKYVKPKIQSKKTGKKLRFRRRSPSAIAPLPRQAESESAAAKPSVASAVRGVLANNPNGLTARQILNGVDPALVASVADGSKAVGAALFKMKKRGVVAHNAEAGTYRLMA